MAVLRGYVAAEIDAEEFSEARKAPNFEDLNRRADEYLSNLESTGRSF